MKKPVLSHELMILALKDVSQGHLNVAAVARSIGLCHGATVNNMVTGVYAWKADTWLMFMLAVGLIRYRNGRLLISLEVPKQFRPQLEKIEAMDKKKLYQQRWINRSDTIRKHKA